MVHVNFIALVEFVMLQNIGIDPKIVKIFQLQLE